MIQRPTRRFDYFWYLVLAFIFFIPLSQFLSVRILVVALAASLFVRKNWSFFFKGSWSIYLYLLVSIVGLIYSEDLKLGLSVLETSFCLFALPLIFCCITPFDEVRFRQALLTFIVALVLACTVCLMTAAISLVKDGAYDSFFFYQFTSALDFQPTYFAYFLSFGISVLLYVMNYEQSKISTWVFLLLIVFFFTILMLTAGRTAYIAMLLVFAFFILKFLFEPKRDANIIWSFGISVFLLVCMLLINYFDFNANFGQSASTNDYWERLTLWKSGLQANTNLLLGVGTGDYKTVLGEYFLNHDLHQYAKEGLNAHNQFIQTFLSNGLIGLVCVLFLLGRPLYLSYKYQNVLGIMTFFSFFIYGVTEVFLGRYQGIVFFSFLNQIFVAYYFSANATTASRTE